MTLECGFAGLGAMGYPMAANLRQAGLLKQVWNRSPAVSQRFRQAHGTPVADDLPALARDCNVVVTCVSADQDLLDVVEALCEGIRPGSIVIDSSTVAGDTARQAADRLGARDAAFLDAPVSGGTEGAANGSLTFMVGGDAEAFAQAAPVFQAMGSRIAHMGPAGAGQATKAINQVMAAGIHQAVAEAMRFAQALELPLDDVIDVVGSGAAGNWFVNQRGKTMVREEFAGFGFKTALARKDLDICMRMARDNQGHLPLAEKALADYDWLVEQGYGDEDISATWRCKAGLFGRSG